MNKLSILIALCLAGCGGGGGGFYPTAYYPSEPYIPQPISMPEVNLSGVGPVGSVSNPLYIQPATTAGFGGWR